MVKRPGHARWKGKGLCLSVHVLYSDAEANGRTPEYNGHLTRSGLACR